MGYTTRFEGSVKTDRPVDEETYELLKGLASTRRMKRNIEGYGVDGEFYYDEETDEFDDFGMEDDDDTIVDYNEPPRTQPSLWLQWIIREDRQTIEWDGGEKFYEYVEWMKYIINAILKPRGYVVNGEIEWDGEERRDVGIIVVKDNVVTTKC